jgi:hypothetical protein
MRRLFLAFIAGFIATVAFHQAALWILNAAGLTTRAPFNMAPVPPFGVPAIISLAFWGGIWGALMIPVIDKRRGAAFWIAAVLFGAILPTLVAGLVIAPLKGQAVPSDSKLLMFGLIVNGAWGFGTALIYRMLGR